MNTKPKIIISLVAGVALGAAAVQGLHAQGKAKAYTVTELQTVDAKAAADFAKRISEAQTKAGGRNFRTGGGKVVGLEGPPPPQRRAQVLIPPRGRPPCRRARAWRAPPSRAARTCDVVSERASFSMEVSRMCSARERPCRLQAAPNPPSADEPS